MKPLLHPPNLDAGFDAEKRNVTVSDTKPPTPASDLGRPVSITILSWVFIAAGAMGVIYHARDFSLRDPLGHDLPLVTAVRLLAIIGGAFALRGHNWARWLLLVWISYHVALSISHSLPELAVHSLLLAIVGCVYFRPFASAYFSRRAN